MTANAISGDICLYNYICKKAKRKIPAVIIKKIPLLKGKGTRD